MKSLNVVLAVAGLFALMPSASVSVWAAEKTEGTCFCNAEGAAGVATTVMPRGGKSAAGHAWARAAAAEADKAAELRETKRAEEKARKIAAGEKPAAAPVVVTAPVKVSGGSGGGKASAGHMRARASKAEAEQAAAQNAE